MKDKFIGPTLKIIAEESLPVRPDGTCDLAKLNCLLLNEAKKRNLTVKIKYSSDEKKYEFKIYGAKI